MPYCAYLRKSRADLEAEAHGEGETLARHEAALRALARQKDLQLAVIYREVVSGETIADRPVMRRLLREVEAGIWDGVLVMEVERLARGDTADQGVVQKAFFYSHTLIITPGKTYDPSNEFDQEYLEFGLFMSRREYKTIRRRMTAGRIASVREGKYCGSTPPYGYLRQKLPQEKGWTLTPHPEQATVVHDIFTWYTDPDAPLGSQWIARRLNHLGVPTASGRPWTLQAVRGILQNPVYAGIIAWGRRRDVKYMENGTVITSHPRSTAYLTVPGRHPAIIDPALFRLAQDRLTACPQKRIPGRKVLQNPLSGLIFCDTCGRKMQRRPHILSGGRDALLCPQAGCPTVGAHLQLIECLLLRALQEWLDGYRIRPDTPLAAQCGAALTACRAEQKKLEGELRKLAFQHRQACELVEQKIYTPALFTERQAALSERQTAVTQAIRTVQKRTQMYETRQSFLAMRPLCTVHFTDTYNRADSAAARGALLSAALSRVLYHKTTSTRWAADSDLSLTLFPLLPSAHNR